jgi:PleD family two-component response regulator
LRVSRTALVVEDDIAIRHLVRAALTGHGYRVVEAGDGMAALTACAAALPDVILLDIGLPDMDGLTVLKKVKNDPELREIPVVMVTAWADPDLVRVAMDRGAADYVCKPFALDDLLARVDATGSLPARDHLTEVLEREIRTRRPFAVVVVEVQPDADLHDVAHTFRQRAGVFDSIVPNGDHSLVVVLPRADIERAQARAQTLREALTVEARIGVAAIQDGDDPASLLARAG